MLIVRFNKQRLLCLALLCTALLFNGLVLAGKGENKGGGKGGGGGGGDDPPAPNPAITFVTQGELSIMNEDGSNRMIIVADAAASAPNWSPDGTEIVFANFGNNTTLSGNGIYIVTVDGTSLIQIVNSPSPTWTDTPAWSPDGTEIAYAWADDADVDVDPGQIEVIDLETGIISVLYDFSEGFPIMGGLSWSPDGTLLTVHVSDETLNRSFVEVLDTATGILVEVTPGFVSVTGRSIEWARQSDKIAFVGRRSFEEERALWILDLDQPDESPDRLQLVLLESQNNSFSTPTWSPDDSKLLFKNTSTRKRTGLWLIDLSSGDETLLLRGSHWFPDWRR